MTKRSPRSSKSRSGARERTPLVTIITVCRNAALTIATAIESVLDQSYENIEYVIVDGASTDSTTDIIRSYEEKYRGRLLWGSETDAGIYDAMNKGIARANGSIIGILNSDDWYEKDAVKRVVRSYAAHGEGIHYGILRVHQEGEVELLKAVSPRYLFQDVVGHPAYFVTKETYERHGVFDLQYRYAADYDLMLRLFNGGVQFYMIEAVLANYQQGGQSSIHGRANLEEMNRIRHRYGYLTRAQLLIRILKYRLLDILKRFRFKA